MIKETTDYSLEFYFTLCLLKFLLKSKKVIIIPGIFSLHIQTLWSLIG